MGSMAVAGGSGFDRAPDPIFIRHPRRSRNPGGGIHQRPPKEDQVLFLSGLFRTFPGAPRRGRASESAEALSSLTNPPGVFRIDPRVVSPTPVIDGNRSQDCRT